MNKVAYEEGRKLAEELLKTAAGESQIMNFLKSVPMPVYEGLGGGAAGAGAGALYADDPAMGALMGGGAGALGAMGSSALLNRLAKVPHHAEDASWLKKIIGEGYMPKAEESILGKAYQGMRGAAKGSEKGFGNTTRAMYDHIMNLPTAEKAYLAAALAPVGTAAGLGGGYLADQM